jgi:hypothetical protein
MSTGSIGSNGDQRRLDFGSPPPRGSAGLDVKFRRARSDRACKFAARSPPEGESSFEETSCEEGLGFHTTRYPLAHSDRLFSSFRASTSETEAHRPSMWTHTPATPSPSQSSDASADSGYLSQYDTDGNAQTPLMTGLPPQLYRAWIPFRELSCVLAPQLCARRSPCEATGREDTTTVQQTTCKWWPSRAPPTV